MEAKDQLEIEVHEEKIRVFVDGAKTFLSDEAARQLLMELFGKALDKWLDRRQKRVMERIGLYTVGGAIAAVFTYLGWKGWGK